MNRGFSLRENGKRKRDIHSYSSIPPAKSARMDDGGNDNDGKPLSSQDLTIIQLAANIFNIHYTDLPGTLQSIADYERESLSSGSDMTDNPSIPGYAWPAGLNSVEETGEDTDNYPLHSLGAQNQTDGFDELMIPGNDIQNLTNWAHGLNDPNTFQSESALQPWSRPYSSAQSTLVSPSNNPEGEYVLIHSQSQYNATNPELYQWGSSTLRESDLSSSIPMPPPESQSSLMDSGYYSSQNTSFAGSQINTGPPVTGWQREPELSTTKPSALQSIEDSGLWNDMTAARIQTADPFPREDIGNVASKAPSTSVRKVSKGQLQAFAQNSKQRKRGPFKSAQDRVQTGRTRKTGACVRCRMQRIRCSADDRNPSGICLTCMKTRNLQMPCLRLKITDSCLFRKGDAPDYSRTRRWSNMQIEEISRWKSDDLRTVHLTQFPFEVRPLQVEVKEFVPMLGDKLAREWADPKTKVRNSRPVPNFALANMKATSILMQRFVDQNVEAFIGGLLPLAGGLIYTTYNMAYNRANMLQVAEEERDLLRNCLRLWVAIRMTAPSTYIVRGDESLGMLPENDQSSPDFGKFPISPVMTAQIQLLHWCSVLLPLRKQVLKQLNKFILQDKEPRPWFTIYLTMFILLHSCALVTRGAYQWARKRGHPKRYANAPLIEELHMGAKIFLAHWHHCAKAKLLFGSAEDLDNFEDLDSQQREFLQDTTRELARNAQTIQELRKKKYYEHDLFFVSQLYEDEWAPFDIE